MSRSRRKQEKGSHRFAEVTPEQLERRHLDAAQLFGLLAALALSFGWGVRWTFEPDIEDVRAAAHWPTVRGEILESYVQPPHRAENHGVPIVRYRYRVSGSNYVSTGYKLDIAAWGDDPYEVVARYPKGAQVDVLYKPSDPDTSALEPAEFDLWDRSLLWLGVASRWFGGLALAGALAHCVASQRALRRPAARPEDERAAA